VVKEGPKCRAFYMMLIDFTLKFLSRRKNIIYIPYTYITLYVDYILYTHTHTQLTIITVEVYSAQNVLKGMIQIRNSGMSGKSASIACDVIGVRE